MIDIKKSLIKQISQDGLESSNKRQISQDSEKLLKSVNKYQVVLTQRHHRILPPPY
jgi:hypothetical protein